MSLSMKSVFVSKWLRCATILAGLVDINSAATQAQGAGDSDIEEIIVTATKREESVQTVGLSVTAVSGEELLARGAVDFVDFAVSVPNLAFGSTDDGVLANRTISLRGIEGLNTTSFYIDDVPLDESLDPLVLDVERIEVLRGPQGTLFGARGLGGTIRIITKKPEFDRVFGSVHAAVSNTKQSGNANYSIDGNANIPFTDSFAARITAYYNYEEGVFDRVVGPSTAPGVASLSSSDEGLAGDAPARFQDVDDKEIYGGQLALRFDATDRLTFNGKVMYQRTELSGFPLADFVTNETTGNLILEGDDFTQERLFTIEEGGTDEWLQLSLNASFETSFGTFTSSTGYFTRDTFEQEDTSEFVSFTLLGPILQGAGLPTAPTAIPSPIFQTLEFDTFVEEIRFVSEFDSPMELTLGAFYQDTQDNEAFDPPNIASGFDAAFSGFLGAPEGGLSGTGDLIFTSNTPTDIEEIGVFGEFTYNLSERLRATLGARYFDTEVASSDVTSGFAAGGLDNIVPLTTQQEEGFNFKGLVEYEATDSIFLYASIAEGFRIGGTNGLLPATLGCPAQAEALGFAGDEANSFTSDSLVSYEAGAKTSWYDGRFSLNAAAFHIDFDNIQQRVLLTCGFDFVGNVGAARSRGFELEASARPAKGWLLQASAGYTEAEFTEDVAGIAEDREPLQQVPKWTVAATIDHEAPAFEDFMWFLRSDFSYVGSSISTVVDSNSPRVRPSFSLINARAGLRNQQYEFVLFVDNLFDDDAIFSDNRTLAAEAAGRPRIVRGRPRTIGVEIRSRF